MCALTTAASCHAPAHGRTAYERHCPETTLLYRTLQKHWLEFVGEIEDGGGELPGFVRDEFVAYLRCGILAHGFLRLRCTDCGHNRVVAFSCKRRGFCPSCLGRRMADTAVFCVRPEFGRGAASEEPREIDPSGIPRLGRLPWAVLLKRVFLVDVLECPKCKGRILVAVTAPESVRRVLGHLGLPSEAPRLRAARPPPQLNLARGREPSDGFYPDPTSPDW